MRTTFMQKSHEVDRKWFVVDAADKTLGRLSTEVATLLRGKHKPTFTPHVDCGDYVIVINAEKINLTGKELERFIAKTDKERADYYKYYTGREWTDARNYDLCLDSSKLGFERCVEEIIAYMNVRFK